MCNQLMPMRLKSLLNDRIEEVITLGTSGRTSFPQSS